MSGKDHRRIDGSRRRCTRCGHPQREHHRNARCTVPQCACDNYEQAEDLANRER